MDHYVLFLADYPFVLDIVYSLSDEPFPLLGEE